MTRLCRNRWINCICHGNRVGHIKTGKFCISRTEFGHDPLNIDGEFGAWSSDASQTVGFLGNDDCVASRNIPADEFEWQTRLQDDLNGMGVNPHIELSDRIHIADVIGCCPHEDDTRNSVGNRGVSLDRERKIGEGAEGDKGELAGVLIRRFQECVDGVALVRSATGER